VFLSLDFVLIDETKWKDLSSSVLVGTVGRIEEDSVCVEGTLCLAH
jgi:hypothetical protein